MAKLQAKNEMVVNAPISKVWMLITDIEQLHKINPGVISASGSMNQLNATRTCKIENKGKIGIMTERLIEMVPEQKTVWTIVEDTMGMSKMLKETEFCFKLEKINDRQVKVINESYYTPSNFIVSIMNQIIMKRMMTKIQEKILLNIKNLSENN